ncbi:mediator of RNA polymerase II transcription subunit 6 [Anopheles ziemanni]|uniref:mediator of RNA polymerase II transcription subunit 6 n=1 Tax=Anopheles coustani TaxID=139045 RepID=UPI002659CB54|nr:mediator of RNA polymerase II transcription subunit 6 [Anopheles coustani]XP_058173831.1 mediator of RNA polymerase II transcription subunit 6 [Anopheles ziemanni]
MNPGRLGLAPIVQENPLWISWHDSNWIPVLNPGNVMDYFSEKSNPFYDRTCNNEIVRMQRQSLELLNNMTGVEYILLHVQDPILYVIRKQHRHSPTEATPMADYYIIAGTVYQAPDLASVFNSRILSTVHHLQTAFDEASSYSRYHPSKGYSWDFSSNKAIAEKTKTQTKKEAPVKEEPSSIFQRQRVDMLLGDLLRKFPLPLPQVANSTAGGTGTDINANNNHGGAGSENDHSASDHTIIKQEPSDGSGGRGGNSDAPVEKKMKM